jgi:hypothetical protein
MGDENHFTLTGTMQKKPRMNTNGRELQGRFGDLATSM